MSINVHNYVTLLSLAILRERIDDKHIRQMKRGICKRIMHPAQLRLSPKIKQR